MNDRDWLHTDVGGADADTITVRGRNLATELMGTVTFTELTFLLVQGRAPTPQETVLLDAVLVSLAEHGLTPTVLAARLTHTGAPESLQGAVAAAHREATGKTLPINGAGVAGAALADLGFPARIVRGMALLARTAGLVAHLDEEMARGLGMRWRSTLGVGLLIRGRPFLLSSTGRGWIFAPWGAHVYVKAVSVGG